MRRQFWWTIGMWLVLSLTIINAQQQDTGKYQTWELAPMLVVSPGERLTLLTTAPLSAYQTRTTSDGSISARRLLWHAVGGYIEEATDHQLIYLAPTQDGIYLVYWEDPDNSERRFGFFVKVKTDGDGEIALPETTFYGFRGAFVPLTRSESAPVALFLVDQRKPTRRKPGDFLDDSGNYRVDTPKGPFFPEKRPTCQNNRCGIVWEEGVSVVGIRQELGTITITGQLALKLRELGVSFTYGATIKVIANITRTMYYTLIDCYRCENGRCKYDGSRVEYMVCEKVNGYTAPAWLCDAISRWRDRYPGERPLFPEFPPCGEPQRVERDCVSGGMGCECPLMIDLPSSVHAGEGVSLHTMTFIQDHEERFALRFYRAFGLHTLCSLHRPCMKYDALYQCPLEAQPIPTALFEPFAGVPLGEPSVAVVLTSNGYLFVNEAAFPETLAVPLQRELIRWLPSSGRSILKIYDSGGNLIYIGSPEN